MSARRDALARLVGEPPRNLLGLIDADRAVPRARERQPPKADEHIAALDLCVAVGPTPPRPSAASAATACVLTDERTYGLWTNGGGMVGADGLGGWAVHGLVSARVSVVGISLGGRATC